jgi:hypothetical protein
MVTDQARWETWFQDLWTYREEVVYRNLFGDIGTQIHTLPRELFERIGLAEIDPRWLVHGVFECPPAAGRKSWVYVTSCLSNPWGEDPSTVDLTKPSGLGFELMLETPGKVTWGIHVLQWLMAMQILAASGMLKGELLQEYDTVPLQMPIDPATDSAIRNLLICTPDHIPNQFELASGEVRLLLCIGITDAELAFSRGNGADVLEAQLKAKGIYPLTDSERV